MIFKFFINIILIGNENIGIKGAAMGNIICNLIVCLIGYIILVKNIKLKIDFINSIFKPIFSTIIMIIIGLFINFLLKNLVLEKIKTIASILTTAGTYAILILIFKPLKQAK